MIDSKRGEIAEETYQKIKNMMYYNELVPGQKIIYRDISERLNKSITPIIQALKRLEDSNIVQYKPNKGYFVGHITQTEVKELYEAREALEISIIPSILKNLCSSELKDIKEDFKRNSISDRRRLILKDAQFHLRIYKISGNSVIYGLLNSIFEQICIKYRPEYTGDDRVKEVLREHHMILGALRKGDVEETIASIREHTMKGREYMIDSLRRHEEVMSEEVRLFRKAR